MPRPPAVPKRRDPEEDYFYHVNQELIRAHRERLDEARRALEKEQSRYLHWLKCPKCGGDMKTNSVGGINAEQCADCHGVFFDQAELALLLKSREPSSFLDSLRERLEKSINLEDEWQVPSH